MLATSTWSNQGDLGSSRTLGVSFVAASILLAAALTAAVIIKPAPAPVVEKSVEVTFVKEMAPPPPPPPPAPLLRPQAPPPAAAPVVPKHLKRIVVDKVRVKPLRAPVKVVKGPPAEADPSLDRGVEVAGEGLGDPAGLEGGAVGADPMVAAVPLPESATPPRPLSGNALPAFPVAAREAGKEGLVVLRIVVGLDGAVEAVEVLRGEDPFVEAAVQTVRSWRYRPAMQAGSAIRVQHIVRIPFQLRA